MSSFNVSMHAIPRHTSAHRSHLDGYIRRETWSEPRGTGECSTEFAARVCSLQFGANRHLLLEPPAGSELVWLACFEMLWSTGRLCKEIVFQCALGLEAHGEPTYIYIYIYKYSSVVQQRVVARALSRRQLHLHKARTYRGWQ